MARVKKVKTVKWKSKPDAHDYPAAANFLSLLVADTDLRAALVAELQAAPVVSYKAKDLLRASQLPPLTAANAHVALDLRKIRKRVPLSPVLLVRGDLVRGFPLQVADGYHRVCASHLVDENTDIPCRLIDLPAAASKAAHCRRAQGVGRAPGAAAGRSGRGCGPREDRRTGGRRRFARPSSPRLFPPKAHTGSLAAQGHGAPGCVKRDPGQGSGVTTVPEWRPLVSQVTLGCLLDAGAADRLHVQREQRHSAA